MTHGIPDPDQPAPARDTEWEALARYVSGESAPDEVDALRRRLAEHPGDSALVEALDRAIARPTVPAADAVDVESALRQVKARRDTSAPLRLAPRPITRVAEHRRPVFTSRMPFFAIAAAAILAVSLLLWRRVVPHERATVASSTTFETTVGERDSLRLPDGTLVMLAPRSRVTLAAGYGDAHRTVELQGEAFFEVAHDDSHPFVVRAGAAAIRDIGTAFTVREEGRDSVVVAVTTGTVLMRVAASSADSGVVLHAGDMGTLGPAGRVVAQRGAGEKAPVRFVGGALVFRDATMAEVAGELHRWFGISFHVADAGVAGRRLSATFTGESPQQVLDVIRTALGAEFELRGDTVVARSAKGDARPR